MRESRGLQIDLQCVKCGRPPTTDIPLFEMQNHLYICNVCRIKEEQSGKHIAWVDGLQLDVPAIQEANNSQGSSSPKRSIQEAPARAGIFAALEVSAEASSEEVVEGIKKKMRYWMRQPASSEKDQTIDQLREWQQEIANDTQFLAKQRTKQDRVQSRGSALQMGSNKVYTLQEFVATCEHSSDGWMAGEMHLRSGELEYWIYSQTGNRVLAEQVNKTAQSTQKDFQALNYILYILLPERPFRLYTRQDAWEGVRESHTATTQTELARLSDLHWVEAQNHLYNGAMILWLERSRGIDGLAAWCIESIKDYWSNEQQRGLGLELLLERAVPTLTRPEIVVTFNDSQGQYVLEQWDNEIPHQPLHLKINNVTRGATIINLELVKPEQSTDTDWLYLEGTKQMLNAPVLPPPPPDQPPEDAPAAYKLVPLQIYSRPGERNPVVKMLFLQNLAELDYGQTYTYKLRMSIARASHQPPVVHEFPIAINSMGYRQGFRRELWKWGLRGHLPGLCWNFLTGAVLALMILLLAGKLPSYFSINNVFQILLAEVKEILVTFLGLKFVFSGAAITGFIGLRIGAGKGHANYPIKSNAKAFRKWGFWCALIFFIGLFFLESRAGIITNTSYYDASNALFLYLYLGANLSIGILTYLIACILSILRSQVEILLRKRNVDLLKPQESR